MVFSAPSTCSRNKSSNFQQSGNCISTTLRPDLASDEPSVQRLTDSSWPERGLGRWLFGNQGFKKLFTCSAPCGVRSADLARSKLGGSRILASRGLGVDVAEEIGSLSGQLLSRQQHLSRHLPAASETLKGSLMLSSAAPSLSNLSDGPSSTSLAVGVMVSVVSTNSSSSPFCTSTIDELVCRVGSLGVGSWGLEKTKVIKIRSQPEES